ncbi:type I-G CRISPR-associated RAMP protein Csb1/Cas7g [Alicyclobacillus acidocaldarius]|uniref:CRISPR-associated protein, GSU0053 family n=1 Tax=Alicyclobacillus acidocaldarius subsp. acidocaldarius (strain ATCC 27009 / DSM 446 / BCRC 14685 / JCM 5260 / KCTC 1825 / NBRC 15652 / NCIMB 11725 / NRRL B-14509 / 104-IA) TaxID=521098 RepID=C8WTQ9_ALIAD|nr:type I-U CRISPR-associated RAMP protein Csb1/Cas7u [Alicyclobacillus acidocaldarius]ACV59651.1 CRISPR-associated protein, GSU0053 family [Alicyclobacillus acidocaldarius subsp. acidocaldarius DSM 446]
MTISLEYLNTAPRLLLRAELTPIAGTRFQPTGFPDLGAAEYDHPSEPYRMLLVESPQSMANRMEKVCWDDAANDWRAPLKGLPRVDVYDQHGEFLTNSVLEAHRLNSPYILEGKDTTVAQLLKRELGIQGESLPVDVPKLARTVFKYDPNSVLHGLFLAKKELAGGRLRLTRMLSGFIEAEDARVAPSGGVKNDRVDPTGPTNQGFGNVPFHRDEYVARRIHAYFVLDLALLRSYGLGATAETFVILFALYKIRHFLDEGLRLRTACDFDVKQVEVLRPTGFQLPTADEIDRELPGLIERLRAEGLLAAENLRVRYDVKS